MDENLSGLLDLLLNEAKKAGASAADAVASRSASLGVTMRGGVLNDLERSENAGIGLRVLVGQKQASLATSDLRRESLEALAARAVATARLAPGDPYAGIAGIAQCATSFPDLDLFDSTEPAPAQLIEKARSMEEAARAVKGVAQVEESAAGHTARESLYAASNGFRGQARGSMHQLSVSAIAGEGTGMVRDWDYAMARHAEDLRGPAQVGREAGERAAARLGARKPATVHVPVIFAPRAASALLHYFLSAIDGQAVARRASFLAGSLNQPIFQKQVGIIDDPAIRRGLRARNFDGEGLPCVKSRLVDEGKLNSFLLNLAAARQLGLAPTGHARRGTGGVPGAGASNVYIEKGSVTPEELMSDMTSGFLVTETMGFGVNNLTGDFSQGAAGFWIGKGEKAYPVHEATLAGNLKDMFQNLTPADDLEFKTGADSPSLRVEGMTVAGT